MSEKKFNIEIDVLSLVVAIMLIALASGLAVRLYHWAAGR